MEGITVTLYERTQTGADALNAPVWSESAVEVENVLYGPAGTQDAASAQGLENDASLLDLYIPKGDTHAWTGCRVDIPALGSYRVVGRPEEWIEANVPGPWNRRVRVRRYE